MEGLVFLIRHEGWKITYMWRFIFLESVSFLGSIPFILVLARNKWLGKYLFHIKPVSSTSDK